MISSMLRNSTSKSHPILRHGRQESGPERTNWVYKSYKCQYGSLRVMGSYSQRKVAFRYADCAGIHAIGLSYLVASVYILIHLVIFTPLSVLIVLTF